MDEREKENGVSGGGGCCLLIIIVPIAIGVGVFIYFKYFFKITINALA